MLPLAMGIAKDPKTEADEATALSVFSHFFFSSLEIIRNLGFSEIQARPLTSLCLITDPDFGPG